VAARVGLFVQGGQWEGARGRNRLQPRLLSAGLWEEGEANNRGEQKAQPADLSPDAEPVQKVT
jgi:hypothetical protein